MEVVRLNYASKEGKTFEGTFIKIGLKKYIPVQVRPELFEPQKLIKEKELTEADLLR